MLKVKPTPDNDPLPQRKLGSIVERATALPEAGPQLALGQRIEC